MKFAYAFLSQILSMIFSNLSELPAKCQRFCKKKTGFVIFMRFIEDALFGQRACLGCCFRELEIFQPGQSFLYSIIDVKNLGLVKILHFIEHI